MFCTPALVTATGDFSGKYPRDVEELLEPKSNPRRPGAAQVWEVPTGRPITPALEHEGVVQRASFSPDGPFLLTTCVSRVLKTVATSYRQYGRSGATATSAALPS
jgi:hypothetical protein